VKSASKGNAGGVVTVNSISPDGNGNITLVEGNGNIDTGLYSHAEGSETQATGDYSHSEGEYGIASGPRSHVEGEGCTATGNCAHAEGYYTSATGKAHAEGDSTTASGIYSHAEGNMTVASGASSHAEGQNTIASGNFSHAEGAYNVADGYCSHTEGQYNKASGSHAHAEGTNNTASGNYSHAGGAYNQAKCMQTAIGQFGTISASSDTTYNATGEALMIGNGSSDVSRGLAFKVMFNGLTYADGAYASTGADYAEYFEWLDQNLESEDRVGFFVALDGEKIRKANSTDDYILGVISSTPSVVGDNYESWQGKYITDEWDRIQYHEVLIPATYIEIDGELIIERDERTDIQPIYNPEWNSSQEYITREHRIEWSPVGMMGKLLVRDDGTCQVNGCCGPNDDGIATAKESGYRVIKRINENLIKVIVK